LLLLLLLLLIPSFRTLPPLIEDIMVWSIVDFTLLRH
jgi:hypothetical protein